MNRGYQAAVISLSEFLANIQYHSGFTAPFHRKQLYSDLILKYG